MGAVVVMLSVPAEPLVGGADEESEPPVVCEPPPVCVAELEPGAAVVVGAEVAVADVEAGAEAVVLGAAVTSGLLPAFNVDGLCRVFQSYEKRTPFIPFSSLSRFRRLYQQNSEAKVSSN